MDYNFSEIERKWQEAWDKEGIYAVSNNSDKPHYYVLDMFPYPSGAGLHVGHPLGYIASDIYSRYISDASLIPGLERSPGGGHGNPL